MEHHRAIAKALFLNDPSGQWTESSNLVKLGTAVKNRITTYVYPFPLLLVFYSHFLHSLKTAYKKNYARMSETGQGLLDEGREDDIIDGSEIANIWGA